MWFYRQEPLVALVSTMQAANACNPGPGPYHGTYLAIFWAQRSSFCVRITASNVQPPKATWRLGASADLSSRSSRENTWNWLVVDLHLWKIWVRQLGWWNSQYMEKSQMCQTTNQDQEMNWTDTSPGHSKSVFAPATQSESSTISGLGKNNCQSLNSCMKGTYFRK